MKLLSTFYDVYHLKNRNYAGVIGENNFTYFYILEFFNLALKKRFARKKVLDVGCGVGTIALYMAQKGAQVKGIDISQRAIKIAKAAERASQVNNVTFVNVFLSRGKNQYDLVTCFEVIEHVKNETKLLSDIRSNLKKNGVLILSTPSSENLLYRLGVYKKFDQEVGHLRRYTVANLQHLLESNGFKVKLIRQVEGPLRNLLYIWHLDLLIRVIRGPLVPIFHAFDRLSSILFGAADIQVWAVKK